MEGKEIPRQCARRRRILLLLLLLVFRLSFSKIFFSTGIDSRRRIIRYRYRNPICKRHTQGLVTLIGDHARRLTMVVGDTRWPADNGSPCTDADRIAGSVERIRCVTGHYFNALASNRCNFTVGTRFTTALLLRLSNRRGTIENLIFFPPASTISLELFQVD